MNVTEKGTYVTSPGYSSGDQYVDNTQCNWMVQVRSSIGVDFVVSENIIYIYKSRLTTPRARVPGLVDEIKMCVVVHSYYQKSFKVTCGKQS